MITMIREITIRGDEFGKNKDRKGNAYNVATRNFIITVNGVIDVAEIYEALPELGDLHPFIPKCRVDDVRVTATNDPNVWEATVQYETFDSTLTSTIRRKEEEEEEAEPEEQPVEEEHEDYPWLQPAAVTFSSDSSQTQAMEYCYAKWEAMPNKAGSQITTIPVDRQSDEPTIPIVNEPLLEKFASVPEEPIACLAINISFAMRGFANMTPEGIGRHDNTSVLSAVNAEFFTVNKATTSIFGYQIKSCCGYVSSINMERSYYTDKQQRKWAYFQITIQILNNPSTWIRRIGNVSKNMYLTDDTGAVSISPIVLYDGRTKLSEPITEPTPIDPVTGKPIRIDDDGKLKTESPAVPLYIIPVLTKRPSYWTELLSVLNQVEARA